MNDIFTPGEGFCSYNEEQLELLRIMAYGQKKQLPDIKKEIDKDLAENVNSENKEEDGEYILGLA